MQNTKMIARAVRLSIFVIVCLALISEARPPPQPENENSFPCPFTMIKNLFTSIECPIRRHILRIVSIADNRHSTTTTTDLPHPVEPIISVNQEVSNIVVSNEEQQLSVDDSRIGTESSSSQTNERNADKAKDSERNGGMNEEKHAEKEMDNEKDKNSDPSLVTLVSSTERPVPATGGPVKRHVLRMVPISDDDQSTTGTGKVSDLVNEIIKSDAEKIQIENYGQGKENLETKEVEEIATSSPVSTTERPMKRQVLRAILDDDQITTTTTDLPHPMVPEIAYDLVREDSVEGDEQYHSLTDEANQSDAEKAQIERAGEENDIEEK